MSKTTEKAADNVRVFNLAKELRLDNKALIEICQDLGFDKVKNQLNSLTPEQAESVRKRLTEGPAKPASGGKPSVAPVVPAALPKSTDTKVRNLGPAKPKPSAPIPSEEPVPVEPPVVELEPAPAPEVKAAPVPPPPAPALGRGVENMLNPSQIPSMGARPMGGVRNLAGNRPPAPRPPAPSAPNAPTAPAPVVNQLPPPPVEVAPTAGEAVAAPAPTPVEAVVAAPQAVVPVAPPKPFAPPNNPGRPMNLAGPQRSNPGSPGAPRPNPAPPQKTNYATSTPPRSNFPPPNPPGRTGPPPGSARSGPGGVSTPSNSNRPAGPKPPAPVAPPSSGPRGQIRLTPDQIKKMRELENKRGQKLTSDQVAKQIVADGPPNAADRPPSGADGPRRGPGGPANPAGPSTTDRRPMPGARPIEDDDDKKGKKGPGGAPAPGGSGVIGRDGRHVARQIRDRRGSGPTDKGSVIIGAGGQVDLIEQQSGSRKGPRAALLAKMKRQKGQVIKVLEGNIEITVPITLRSLSEAIGMKLGELSKRLLKDTQQLYGANSQIDFDIAEDIAFDKGITLIAKKAKTAKDLLMEKFKDQEENVDLEKLVPRPPIVVIMGHVDHGKTSLLDRIRQQYGLSSDVVSTEAGGITQVLRAWRVEKDGKPITFLDTPGHEAFTKMRARGANVTDIAVIVVAATDGVMPQTEEAINHAKAAGVDIIVAINKVDMPNANLDKTRRQLYQLELLPDNMGGEIQFIETSAVTGQGVGDLLDAIGLQAELSDPPLVADPGHKPSGTCLEAYLDGDKGVMATLLVQQGTLRKGDVILCGASHGRVRSMYDDLGRSIDEAGPSTPVKVFGLDVVPDADDPFYFVDEITKAAEIAEQERQMIREAELQKFSPVSLDSLRAANAKIKITELKIILKAEARGSVEAIKKELEKLTHEEVRCKVLIAGIGAISEADVTLALTSPADTLVIGFNVTADDAALKLSEARGISLREYQIIYNLVDDVRAALEGRLKPIEEVVHLGRAVIRETFKVSKVGTIAGCYVTSGQIERNARVRVIREGTVVYPPAGKTLGLDSLKRFKDDAKEVREGFECGMKIVGFDDVKVGDVIEAYRIDIKSRTL